MGILQTERIFMTVFEHITKSPDTLADHLLMLICKSCKHRKGCISFGECKADMVSKLKKELPKDIGVE